MHYFLRQNLFETLGMIEVAGHTPITAQYRWIAGLKFDTPVPAQTLQLDPTYGSNHPDFFDTTLPLMSKRLLQALQAAGVDNVDSYPMTLVRADTNEQTQDYSAVNVVGCVDAVDLGRSQHEMAFGEPEFTGSIVIDAAKTRDLQAFRLLQGPGFIVVTERLAVQLQAGNFAAVLLQPTTAYAGL